MTERTFADIPGVFVGHATNETAGTGCTVVVCPAGAVGAVDVAGGAPASRETDLLRPEETVECLHAVVLSGGSAFGLAASCGAADELERRGIGLDTGVAKVPIVASACLFDLVVGDAGVRPGVREGAAAVSSALDGASDVTAQGNVGAGTGCTVGKFAGPLSMMKGGLGWSVQGSGELVCGAVAAVNAVGSVVDPDTGTVIAGARVSPESMDCITDPIAAVAASADAFKTPLPRTNTTLSCVVTNARLTKAQATKVAQMCSDAYAHAIKPAHTTNDGDTVFVMATGEVEMPVDVVGALGQQVLARAIVHGCSEAETAYGVPGAKTLREFGE